MVMTILVAIVFDVVYYLLRFKFLGVIFVRSLIMTPFDKPKKERKIVHIPRPLSHEEYKSLKEAT